MARTGIVQRRLAPPLIVLALLAAAVALPATASAAAWVAAQALPENPVIVTPGVQAELATSPGGEQVVVLLGGKGGTEQTIQYATRAPGAAWSSFTQVIHTTSGTMPAPALAMDPAGNAVLAYSDNQTATAPCAVGAGTGCVHLLYKPAGGSTFTQEKLLLVPQIVSPQAAMDPTGTGNATVVWSRNPTANTNSTVDAVQRTSGAWSGVQTAVPTTAETFGNASVAYDSSGVPVVLVAGENPFQCVAPPCTDTLRTAAFNGSSWAASQVEQSTTDYIGLNGAAVSLTRGLGGELDTIYVKSNQNTNAPTIRMATRPIGAAPGWNPPTTIFTPVATDTITGPQLVVAADSSALATWQDTTGGGVATNVAAARPPGGSFGAPVPLESGNISDPTTTQDAQGNATVAWFNSGTQTMRFSQRPHGGALGGVFDAASSAVGAQPLLAADNAGNVSLVWRNGNTSLQSQVYDDAGPSLSLGALPASAPYAGDSVPFSASAGDLWSNPVSVHWDFGDGQGADGTSVSHTYATAGTYNAKAIATDASGNSSTQTFTPTIVDRPVVTSPPPPPSGNTLPPPELGISINVFVLKDPVFIKLPGEKKFKRLTVKQAHLPNGTIIDTRKGRVLVVIDNGAGGTDSAEFYEGVFEVNQPKRLKGIANIFLNGGGFKGCPKAPKDPHAQLSAGKKPSPHRSVRHLWGKGTGKFRTVGRFASATVRGTQWLTDDHCDGTLVRVKKGKVLVRDFAKQENIVVPAPKRYFAGAKATGARK